MADDETAFPTLDATQISFLGTLGERQSMGVGEYLYRSGDDAYDFFVIVSGQVDILLDGDGQERLITQHGAGRFLGELNLLTGQHVYVSARVSQPGEFLRVPARVIRQVIATDARLGDTILTAYMARRDILLSGAASSIRLLGSRYRAETHTLREFLTRSRIPHEWLDPESDESVERLVDQLGIACTDLPVVIMSGAVLANATPGSVAEYLGLTVDRLPDRCFDLLIVGGGAAGLAAAVYGASEGLSTLAVESLVPGGQAGTSSRIENYLGFPTGISGGDLTQRAFVQAEKFGANVTSPCAATSLREAAGHLIVGLADGTDVAGRAVIAATGARYRRLPVDGREALEGKGVYYAATEMEHARVRYRARGRRWWWQLRRSSRGLSRGQRQRRHRRHPQVGPQREHVALPRRSDRGAPQYHGARQQHDHRGRGQHVTPRRATLRPLGRRRTAVRGLVLVHRRRAGDRMAVGLRGARPATGSYSRTAPSKPIISTNVGRSRSDCPCRTRRATPGCSRLATCGPDRRSGLPQRWEKARRPCGRCTSTSPSRTESRMRVASPVRRTSAAIADREGDVHMSEPKAKPRLPPRWFIRLAWVTHRRCTA